jgi:hypothetical protein
VCEEQNRAEPIRETVGMRGSGGSSKRWRQYGRKVVATRRKNKLVKMNERDGEGQDGMDEMTGDVYSLDAMIASMLASSSFASFAMSPCVKLNVR